MATEMVYRGLDNEHKFMCEAEGKGMGRVANDIVLKRIAT